MDIQNISALESQLTALGFDKMRDSLLKRIPFRLANFVLTRKIEQAQGMLTFHLFFSRISPAESYSLMYYDAIFQKDSVPEFVNGVDIGQLQREIQEINWKAAFDLSGANEWTINTVEDYAAEIKLEKVMHQFYELEQSEEGKAIATNLKLRYWTGSNYQELFGNLVPVKTKTEISQRFYFSAEHSAISLSEASRFLQNKWLEKEIRERKKDAVIAEEQPQDAGSGAGGSLLRKRHLSSAKKSRKGISK